MFQSKRILSFFLAIILTLSLLPATVLAVDTEEYEITEGVILQEQTPSDTIDDEGNTPNNNELLFINEMTEGDEIPFIPELPYNTEVTSGAALEIEPMSLLPLTTQYVSLDLSGKTEAQLKTVSIADMLLDMGVTINPGEQIAWGYWIDEYEYYPGYFSKRLLNDTYHIIQTTDTLDMRPTYSGSSSYSFEFIVGKGRQLDYTAQKYSVNVSVTSVPTDSYYFATSLYTDGDTRTKLFPLDDNSYGAGNDNGVWKFYLYVPTNYPLTSQYNLGLYWRESYYESQFSGLTVSIYDGHHDLTTVNSATLVNDLWASNISSSGGYKATYNSTPQNFTLVFSKSGTNLAAQKISFVAYPLSPELQYLNWKSGSDESWGQVYDTTYELGSYVMEQTNELFKLRFIDGATGATDNSKITSVKIGSTDITSTAIGVGYTVDTSASRIVTVVANGTTYTITIPKESTTTSEDQFQSIGSSDVYFRVQGATGISSSDIFIVPYNHDTYYYNGYQTVLINATGTDLTSLMTTYWNGPDIYAGGVKQTSGVSTQDFSSERVQYTAKATNNADLKNYKVAFVDKTETDANLFVNGPLGNGIGGTNERYVRFDDYYGPKHDIFIANTGGASLTSLSVELTDAQNIALDDWYTIGGSDNDSLNAFTKTGSIGYTSTGIDSAAKIRLIPTGDGDINGILTITADGVAPVVINLTGKAGNPKINTTQAQVDSYPAVKWVPYSFLVTTDNEYDWTTVRFSRSAGTLPPGLTLRQNGEIYGIPTTPGTYTFTVTTQFSGRVSFPYDSKEYTITILENTDTNVDSTVQYPILTRVPATVNTQSDQVFEIDGAFGEFMDFYIDGNKMTENTDYTVEDGSTKITINAQTLNNSGAGTHTIAAEFRVNGNTDDEMKRSAQNTTVERGSTGGNSGGSIGGGGGGSSSTGASIPSSNNKADFDKNGGKDVSFTFSSGSYTLRNLKNGSATLIKDTDYTVSGNTITLKASYLSKLAPGEHTITLDMSGGTSPKFVITIKDTTPTSKPVTEIFTDVVKGSWYEADVQWAYDNGYMVGTSATTFDPNTPQTQTVIFNVLARLADVNLYNYADKTSPEIMAGQWYTNAAQWAKSIGLMVKDFAPDEAVPRGDMAVIIVRYFKWLGVEINVDDNEIIIADEDLMTAEQKEAFSILYRIGIFSGVSDTEIRMNPTAGTSRSELAALLHRLSDYMDEHKKP